MTMNWSWAGGGLRLGFAKPAPGLYPKIFKFFGAFFIGILMKNLTFSLLVGCLAQICLEAQPLPQPPPQNTNGPAALAPATIVKRSANERVWARISTVTNADGSTAKVQTPAYTELATGLCRFSMESNAWVDADASIEINANGAAATGTRHSVAFSGDSAAAGWAVHLTDEDGKTFVASVYALSYLDIATGSNVLLGSLQSSQGMVIGDREVV
jgi:hypothetical protein